MNKYESYKDSGVEWIGEIPSHWEVTKHKFNLSILSGYPFNSDLFNTEKGIPLIRIRDITSGMTETYYDGPYDDLYTVRKGDLLIGMDGDFNVRWWSNEEGVLNQRCCSIKEGIRVFRKYLFYLLPFELNVINDLTYYTTVKHLSTFGIYNTKTILPPPPEQEQIVTYLDEKTTLIDDLIRQKEHKISLLKEFRTSIINKVVTKGLNPNVPMKDSGVEWIGEIPSHWEVKPLKYIVDENQSTLGSNTPDDFELEYVEISDLNASGKITNTTRYIFSESPSRCRRVLSKGNVFISTVRTYLRAIGIIEEEVSNLICSTGFSVLSPKSGTNSKYLFFMLRTEWFISDVVGNSEGVSYPSIQSDKLLSIRVLLPPLTEQEQIVTYLDEKTGQIDQNIESEQKKIELLKEYRQSLISNVVTGKIKVVN